MRLSTIVDYSPRARPPRPPRRRHRPRSRSARRPAGRAAAAAGRHRLVLRRAGDRGGRPRRRPHQQRWGHYHRCPREHPWRSSSASCGRTPSVPCVSPRLSCRRCGRGAASGCCSCRASWADRRFPPAAPTPPPSGRSRHWPRPTLALEVGHFGVKFNDWLAEQLQEADIKVSRRYGHWPSDFI
jgi:hypothetical protein